MPFLHAMPEEDWSSDDYDLKQELEKGRWSSRYGDRFSCLVLIGVNMDKEAIELNDALLTEKESVELGGVKGWRTLTDPFFEELPQRSFLNYTKCINDVVFLALKKNLLGVFREYSYYDTRISFSKYKTRKE